MTSVTIITGMYVAKCYTKVVTVVTVATVATVTTVVTVATVNLFIEV